MVPALLYFATAVLLLALARRFVARVSVTAALALVLLPLAFTGRALLTGRVLAPVDIPYQTAPLYGLRGAHGVGEPHNPGLLDVACQIVPWRAAVREALGRGEWPLLNRHVLAGDALLGAAQPAVFSPFTLIACLASPAESFDYTAAITFFVALAGAFLFALDLGCSEGAAMFGAIGFAFSGPLALAILWPLAASWALLPLVVLGGRRVVRDGSFGLLLAALVLEILAGHPETVLHVVLIAALWAAFEFARRPSRKALVAGIGAGIAAVLVTAIYILPVVENANQSLEQWFRQTIVAHAAQRLAPHQEVFAGILTSLFPFLHGQKWPPPVRTVQLIGIGSLVLAAAACAPFRRGESRMLAVLFLFCGLATLQVAPVANALHALPLFNVTINDRLLFGAAFCISMLAALGISRLDRWWVFAAIFALLAAGTFTISRLGLTDGAVSPFRRYAIAGELIPLAAAALVTYVIRQPRTALPLLGLLLLGQRIAEDGWWYPAIPRDAAYPHIALLDGVHDGRVVGKGLEFMPNTSALYRVDDVRGYEALTFRRFTETYPLWCTQQPVWFNRVDDLTSPMLSMMNVRYAIVSDHDVAPPGWRVARSENGVGQLLENERALPRAYVPRHVRIGTPRDLVLPEMRGETDFGNRSWVDVPDAAPQELDNGHGTVTLNDDFAGEAVMQRDGWVIVSQAALRGWRASVDGVDVPIHFANHAFLGIHVPAGRHRVKLTFLPQSFVIGRWISAASIAALIAAALLRRR